MQVKELLRAAYDSRFYFDYVKNTHQWYQTSIVVVTGKIQWLYPSRRQKYEKNKIRNKFSLLDGVHFFFVAHRIHQCTSTTHQIWNAKNNNESLSDFQGLFIRLNDGFISSIKHSLSSKKKMIPLSLPMYRKFLSIHFVPTHNGCLILTRLFAQQSWSKETH